MSPQQPMAPPPMAPPPMPVQQQPMQPATPAHMLQQTGELRVTDPDVTRPDQAAEMVMRFYRESRDSQTRQKAMNWWRSADKMLEGNHWEGEMAGIGNWMGTPPVLNKIYATRDKLVSLLMESVPLTEIVPRTSDDELFASQLDGYLKHEWDNNNWNSTVGMAYKKAITHSISFIKTYWDKEGDGGRGTVRLDPVSNYSLFLHPAAMVREGKLVSKYAIHVFKMTRNEILAKYRVDPAGTFNPQQTMNRPRSIFPQKSPKAAAYLNRKTETDDFQSAEIGSDPPDQNQNIGHSGVDTYDVYECWYQDDSRLETTEYDDMDSGVTPLKYPHGRIITVCNGRVLLDKPNPLGFNPFVPITDSPEMDCIYMPSVMNQVLGPQQIMNKLNAQLLQHAMLCANPIKIVTALSGLDKDTTTNRPGQTYMSYDPSGTGLNFVEPPRLGPEVMQAYAIAERMIDEISGMHEVNRGEEPNQARSGIAIERLQMEGRTRSNLRSLFFDEGLKALIRNIVSMFLDFVADRRMFRVLDAIEMSNSFETFSPREVVLPRKKMMIAELRQQQMVVRMKALNVAQVRGPMAAQQIIPQAEQQIAMLEKEIQTVILMPAHDLISLDIAIQTGTRNMTHAAKSQMAIQLFEMGIVTDHNVLKTIDWPGAYRVWQEKRMELAEQAKAQMKMEEIQFEREKELLRLKNSQSQSQRKAA